MSMSEPPGFTRPPAIRFVQWSVFLLGLWNLGRAAVLWRQSDWLGELPVAPDPTIRMVMALIWAIAFLLSWLAFRMRRLNARRLIPLLIVVYGVYEIGMIALFSSEPPAPLFISLYALFSLLIGWVLWRPATKTYFDFH